MSRIINDLTAAFALIDEGANPALVYRASDTRGVLMALTRAMEETVAETGHVKVFHPNTGVIVVDTIDTGEGEALTAIGRVLASYEAFEGRDGKVRFRSKETAKFASVPKWAKALLIDTMYQEQNLVEEAMSAIGGIGVPMTGEADADDGEANAGGLVNQSMPEGYGIFGQGVAYGAIREREIEAWGQISHLAEDGNPVYEVVKTEDPLEARMVHEVYGEGSWKQVRANRSTDSLQAWAKKVETRNWIWAAYYGWKKKLQDADGPEVEAYYSHTPEVEAYQAKIWERTLGMTIQDPTKVADAAGWWQSVLSQLEETKVMRRIITSLKHQDTGEATPVTLQQRVNSSPLLGEANESFEFYSTTQAAYEQGQDTTLTSKEVFLQAHMEEWGELETVFTKAYQAKVKASIQRAKDGSKGRDKAGRGFDNSYTAKTEVDAKNIRLAVGWAISQFRLVTESSNRRTLGRLVQVAERVGAALVYASTNRWDREAGTWIMGSSRIPSWGAMKARKAIMTWLFIELGDKVPNGTLESCVKALCSFRDKRSGNLRPGFYFCEDRSRTNDIGKIKADVRRSWKDRLVTNEETKRVSKRTGSKTLLQSLGYFPRD